MTQLGVQLVGDSAGLKAALGESLAATNKWAEGTNAATLDVRKAFAGVSTEALRAAAAADKLAMAYARYGEGSLGAAAATVRYRRELEGLNAASLGAFRSVGSNLTKYVTAPTVLLGYEAVKMGVNFNKQMLLVQTQAGASAAEVKNLSAAVLKMAPAVATGPVELAQGLYHLESLGLRGAHAIDTLRISAFAAGMGIANLEDVTTALGGVVVTGIKGAQDYQQAMNTLTATVGAGNMRFEDLAGSIGAVAPAAAAAGIDLKELGAAMATMTDRGFSADEAATRLRMALAFIQAPTNKAKTALADMGIDATKLGEMLRQPNGLLNVLNLLHAGVERVGKSRGNRDLLQGFGGGRSGLGIQTLVGSLDSPLSSYDAKLKQVAADEKKAAAAHEAYVNSPSFKLHQDLVIIETDLVKIGQTLTPIAVEGAKIATAIVQAFAALPGPIKTDLGVVIGLLAVGGPLMLGTAAVIRSVKTIGTTFRMLPAEAGPALATVDGEMATTGVAAEGAAAQVMSLRGALMGIAAIGIITVEIQVLEHFKGKILGAQALKLAAENNAPHYGVRGVKMAADYYNSLKHIKSPAERETDFYAHFGGNGAGQQQLLAEALQYLNGGKQRAHVIAEENAANPAGGGGKKVNGRIPIKRAPAPSLTSAERLQIGLAANPNDPALLRQKADADRAKIEALTKQFKRGGIDAGAYTAQMTALEQDLHATTQAIAGAAKKASGASHKLAKAAEDSARVQIANAKTQVEQAKANQDVAAEERALRKEVEAYLAAAHDSRIPATARAQFRTDAATASAQLAKLRDTFTLPLSLQLAQAKAGAGDFGQTSAADVAVASKIKRYDEMLLAKHVLSIQGQIQVYESIAQQNQVLGNQALAGNTVVMSSARLAAGLGLSGSQRIALEQRLSQSEAHGGHKPLGRGALGQSVYIDGDVHVHGVHDEDQLLAALQKKGRRGTATRRGAHAGTYMGLH